MAVEGVGFHLDCISFKRLGTRILLREWRLQNVFPLNPTYESQNSVTNFARFSLLCAEDLDALPLSIPKK